MPPDTKPDRVAWIDAARGLTIVLVVFGHTLQGVWKAGVLESAMVYEGLWDFFHAFRMPLFFFASAIVTARLLEAPRGTRIRHRLLSLAYLFVLWSVLKLLARIAFGAYSNNPGEIGELLLLLSEPQPGMWFIFVLLLFNTTAYLTKSLPALVVLGAAMALTIGTQATEQPILQGYCEYLIYFMVGCRYAGLFSGWGARIGARWALLSWLGFALLFAMLWPLGAHALPPFSIALATLGSIAVIATTNVLTTDLLMQGLRWIGQRSLAIYVLSFLFFPAARVALMHLGVDDVTVHLLGGTLAGVIGPLLVYEVTQRLGLQFLFQAPLPRPAPTKPESLPDQDHAGASKNPAWHSS